jgi:hypothetical protein
MRAPPTEEFLARDKAEDFRETGPAKSECEHYPIFDLRERASSHWVHPRIFEMLEAKLAIKVIESLLEEPTDLTGTEEEEEEEEEEESDKKSLEKIHQLLVFLRAVEKVWPTKVSISNAPASDLFDTGAQEIIGKLDPRVEETRDPQPEVCPRQPKEATGVEEDARARRGKDKEATKAEEIPARAHPAPVPACPVPACPHQRA